jgi:hypothetical protein
VAVETAHTVGAEPELQAARTALRSLG